MQRASRIVVEVTKAWVVSTVLPRTLAINPEEAAVIRECVDRVLAGQALWKICNDLNGRGITTSGGRAGRRNQSSTGPPTNAWCPAR